MLAFFAGPIVDIGVKIRPFEHLMLTSLLLGGQA